MGGTKREEDKQLAKEFRRDGTTATQHRDITKVRFANDPLIMKLSSSMILPLALVPSLVVAAHGLVVIAHRPPSFLLHAKGSPVTLTQHGRAAAVAARRWSRQRHPRVVGRGDDGNVFPLGMVRGGGGGSDDDDDIADDDGDDGESPPDEECDDAVGSSDDEVDAEEDVAVDDVGGDDDVDDGDESEDASTSLSTSSTSLSTSSSSSPSQGTEIGGGGASATAAPQQQQQSRNFGIVTALWASLVFDTLLNKSKRADLFPVATPSLLVPTALLSSGFALAFGVAFLLWRDMENRADEEGGGDGGRMGDWFLSLTSRGTVDSSNDDDDDEGDAAVAVASRTIRARLLLHLSVFGTLCLAGQSLGYRLSRAAPFLGLSAAAVNVHNVLACVSALTKKDEGGGSSGAMVRAALTRPVLSFRGGGEDVGKKRDRLTPFLFRLGAVAACARCIPACRRIHALASGLPGGVAESAMIVNDARQLSLQVASLARLTLFAGASNALHDATSSTSTCSDHFRNHPFFVTLSGMMGLGCLGVGGTILFESFVVSPGCSSLANAVLSQAVVGGVLLMMFGLFASWNSVVGFERHLRVSGLTGKQGVESSV